MRNIILEEGMLMREHNKQKKIIWIMLDSVGIGALPDAGQYGDAGANTCKSIANAMPDLQLPTMNGMGLYHLVPEFALREKTVVSRAAYWARMAEVSKGKDTITGHWEFTGVLTTEPFPTFPNGFPDALIAQLEATTGVSFLGNEVASGTEIIARLGEEHVRTGKPIIYTSADSVLQIAAHEEVISVPELYRICEQARALTYTGPYKVARGIARAFVGEPGNYTRTANRHDYALEVPKKNLLQDLLHAGVPVYAVGKIGDIYAGTAFNKSEKIKSNADGMDKTMMLYKELCEHHGYGLIYVNLVDFDTKYGHRRDVVGYGNALAEFDAALAQLLQVIDDDTVVILTADHGCDPNHSGTDHTREYIPLLLYGNSVKENQNGSITTYPSFADLGATIADYFTINYSGYGTSFAEDVFHND